ncbi:cytochrome b5 domain-containing protein [bacterium]|nr:cytochrome b5 domain-containing protein [bacterium]
MKIKLNTRFFTTVGFVLALVIALLVIAIGLLGSTRGVPNWQILLNKWKGVATTYRTGPTGSESSDATTSLDTTDPTIDGSNGDTSPDQSTPNNGGGGTDTNTPGSGGSGGRGSATPKPSSSTTTPPSSGGGASTPKPTGNSTPQPTPAPTPTPTPAPACSAGGSCTAAQVATHNTQGNCWVIYGSKVYNVTGYVGQHPPGPSYFNSSVCGKDVSSFLGGSSSVNGNRHRHSNSAYSILNSYWYANLI